MDSILPVYPFVLSVTTNEKKTLDITNLNIRPEGVIYERLGTETLSLNLLDIYAHIDEDTHTRSNTPRRYISIYLIIHKKKKPQFYFRPRLRSDWLFGHPPEAESMLM